MKNDRISRFKKARNRLHQRKQELESQLAQINDALAMGDHVEAMSPLPPRKDNPLRHYGDLTAAVTNVLAQGPLTKREIIARLQAHKFAFLGNPLKILDSVIYTRHFEREGKLFALAIPTT